MTKTAYFESEKEAMSACKALKKSGESFRVVHNYDTDTLRYVTDYNPAGLYFGTGTVKVPGIGLVSGQTIDNRTITGFGYASFLNVSGAKKGVMLSYKNSPGADGIIRSHGGIFPDF